MTLDNWQQWEGRVIGGRYALQQYLGGSDHSAVYLTDFGAARAIAKLIPADAADAGAQLAQWQAGCTLRHPNLLRVFEAGRWHADDEQDMFFAVMEYTDENLAEILSERALIPAEVRDMLPPILAALEYLHGQNMVHGSLKPANVMAVGQEIKLAVDGVRRSGTRLARVEDEEGREAPEVFNTGLSRQGDMWALGLLLVESLTQQQPKAEKGGEGGVPVPDILAEPFRSIAQDCLQGDPERRCSIPQIRRMLERSDEVADPSEQVLPIRPEPAPDPELPLPESAAKQIANTARVAAKQDAAEAPRTRTSPSLAVSPEERKAAVQPPVGEAGERESSRPADLNSLLDEVAPAKARSNKLVPIAIAVLLVTILAVFAIVRIAGRHNAEPQPNAVATPQPSTAVSVQQAPVSTANPVARPTSGGVAHQVVPEVSRAAQNSIHGAVKVKVQVDVNASGVVTLAGLSSHGASRYFAQQALEAARQWTFTPPAMDGKPVASRWMLQFDFRRSGVKTESRMIQPKA